jgi:hypothetical protein
MSQNIHRAYPISILRIFILTHPPAYLKSLSCKFRVNLGSLTVNPSSSLLIST